MFASILVLNAFRWPWGESFAMSGFMNARGLMILIYINISLGLGVIETRLFSTLVLVAIVTTALAVPIYRIHFTDAREKFRTPHQGGPTMRCYCSSLRPTFVRPESGSTHNASVVSNKPGNF